MDPDPEGVLHAGRPGVQVEPVKPLDLGFVVHDRGPAGDQDAPPRPGLQVIVVGLEGHQFLFLGRGELGPGGRAEDHILAVHRVVHRQEHHLAVRVEADAPDRDRGEQPQAHVERQGLQPRMISRLIGHVAPPAGFCWRPPRRFHPAARCLPVCQQCSPGRHAAGRGQPPGPGAEGPLRGVARSAGRRISTRRCSRLSGAGDRSWLEHSRWHRADTEAIATAVAVLVKPDTNAAFIMYASDYGGRGLRGADNPLLHYTDNR